MNDHLIVFVKRPRPGKVKTRLAASIGDKEALSVYRWLLDQTMTQVSQLDMDIHIYLDEEDPSMEFPKDFRRHVQSSGDLGRRMTKAFEEQFSLGADRVVIIGSDLPDISAEMIRKAFSALETKEIIVGPAHDGGFYLCGLRSYQPDLFKEITWSRSDVLSNLMINISELELSLAELALCRDLDDVNDLKHFEKSYLQFKNRERHVTG